MKLSVVRPDNGLIIRPDMDHRMGSNISGPSLIRVPDWVPDPLARYYLYFAHHKGTYIRMAIADDVLGPWTMYTPGVLDVADSLFVADDLKPDADAIDADWATRFDEPFLYAHVASPQVLIDNDKHQFRLYYHGLLDDGDQQTRMAVSDDGLRFYPHPPLLGPAYFRVFDYADAVYALSWGGEAWRAAAWEGPFERLPPFLPDVPTPPENVGIRHVEVYRRDDRLTVFSTRIGDCPERIFATAVTLQPEFEAWQVSEPIEILRPEKTWEGTDRPLAPSTVGAALEREQALRDPCVFRDDDGKNYLLYAVAGESGIAIAGLEGLH